MLYSLELCIREGYMTKHCEIATFKTEELPRYNRITNRLHHLIAQAIDNNNFDCLRNDPAAKQFCTEWLINAACAGFFGYTIDVKSHDEFRDEWRSHKLNGYDCGLNDSCDYWYAD